MTKQQSAAVITKYNDDDPSASLKVSLKDIPSELKDGEVLVRMMLRPINPSDMFCMRGRYGGFTPGKLPAVPGLEGKLKVLHAYVQSASCGVCCVTLFLSSCKMTNAVLQALEWSPS